MNVQKTKIVRPSALGNLLLPIKQSRAFLLLWFGQWVSMLGSAISFVILPVIVYSLTGSTTVMGLTMTAYMLPNVLILPLSGFLVDRLDRIKIILLTDVVRFLIMILIAVFMLTDTMTLTLLFILVALYGLMDGLFNPAYSSIRAQVFTPDIRNSANALSQMSNQAVRLLGPAVGGLIVTFFSAGVGFAIDALTYAVSFYCLFLLGKLYTGQSKAKSANASEVAAHTGQSSFWNDFKEGFIVLRSHPWLWITILAFAFINICFSGIIMVLIPWLFKIHYGYSTFWYGFAMAGSGLGAALAAFLFGSRPSWRRRGLWAYGGAFLSGLALLLTPLVSWPPGLLMLMMLEGFGIMMFALVWETSLQELVPTEAFGRVASLDFFGSFALLPIGYLAVGKVADWLGGTTAIALFAAIGMLIVAAVLAVPAIRRFN